MARRDVAFNIRIDEELRRAFVEACRKQDRPAAQIIRAVMDDNMTEMLRNNPPDVVYAAFREALFRGAIRMFQRENEMRNIVLSDTEARDKATRYFFKRTLREVRDREGPRT